MKAVAVAGWVAWALFVACSTAEFAAWTRGSVARSIPFAGGLQTLARQLVLTATLLMGPHLRPAVAGELVVRPAPTFAELPGHEAEPPPSNGDQSPVIAEPAPANKAYVVRPRDDLWSLAETHLNEPLRWREIFDLNRDRPQPDGDSLTDPDLIRPGWTLVLPSDAIGVDAVPAGPVEIPTGSPVQHNASQPAGQHSPPRSVAPTTPQTMRTQPAPSPDVCPPSAAQAPPAPAPNAPLAPTTSHSPGRKSDSDIEVPITIPAGILGAGLLATGAISMVDRLRRAQQRKRAAGRTIRLPAPELRPAETALRNAAVPKEVSRLDQALRALASCLARSRQPTNPLVQAVQVDGDRIEVLFGDPVKAPAGPFTVSVGGRMWVLEKGVGPTQLRSLAEEQPAPIPALVTVGCSDDADVLIDLEAAGCTLIAGDRLAAEAMFRTWALELATSSWADHLETIIVGPIGRRLQGLDRVRVADHVEEIVDEVVSQATATRGAVDSNASGSTLAARLASSDGWVPTVVLCDPDGAPAEAMTQLLDTAGKGRMGLAVVLLSDAPRADRRVEVGETVIVDPPGLELIPPELTVEDASSIEEVIATATDAIYEDDPGIVPAPVGDTNAASPRPPVLVPVGDLGEVEVDRDYAAETAPEVQVNVLGSVEIIGGKERIDRRKSIELVAYLALHPEGVDYGRLRTALWADRLPTQGSFNTTTSLARSRLGQATDGSLYLPHVSNGIYRLGPAVITDFRRFEVLVERASEQTRPLAINSLTEALQLVRGIPFEGTKSGYEWAYVEGMVARMEAHVSDAAHALVELCLESNDSAKAQWAAMQGLKASPGDEVLYRDRMRASDLAGNPAAVEAVMDELCRVAEALEPYDTLHPETIALYDQLSHRRRRTG